MSEFKVVQKVKEKEKPISPEAGLTGCNPVLKEDESDAKEQKEKETTISSEAGLTGCNPVLEAGLKGCNPVSEAGLMGCNPICDPFWNELGSTKTFNDPFHISQFSTYAARDQLVVDYGCGYGRILNILHEMGFQNLMGFDMSSKMIERGLGQYPHLKLKVIDKCGKIPVEDGTVSSVILSTVLCCNSDVNDQKKIIDEIYRVLKPNGIIYLCDFLITDTEQFIEKYSKFNEKGHCNYGVYRTTEGIYVRHHRLKYLFDLLTNFDILWLQQLDFETMNKNPVKTVHLIARGCTP